MAKDQKEKAARLADLTGIGQAFEGESTTMADIEGKELEVLDFKFIPSQYREGEDYVAIQIRINKELKVVNTQAQVVVAGLKNMDKANLPAPAKFVHATAKASGRPYWTIE